MREGEALVADSCAEGPLPLSPRPMVLTFDYRQRLSLRKYQDCGTSPAQSVNSQPPPSLFQTSQNRQSGIHSAGFIFSGDLLSQYFFHKLRDIFCQCHTDITHAMIAVKSDLLLHSHCIVFFQAVPQRHYHMFARCDIISTSNYDTHIPILHIFKGICKAIRFFMCIRILVDGFQSVTLKNTSFLYQSPEPFPLPMKQIIGRIIGGASG